jgi:regulator of sirC expression with transglutaminase-like and TPR domain
VLSKTGMAETGGHRSNAPEPDDEDVRAAQAAAARERFVALARRPEREIDLAEAALLIAAEEYPGLHVEGYLNALDRLAARVRHRLRRTMAQPAPPDADEAALRALHDVLFEEEGFHGPDTSEGYQHQDYFLSGALDRKRGLPIVLSVIYCEVARRAGLEAVGINLPLHFVAQFRGQHTSVLVDPFNRGARLPNDALPAGVSADQLPVASKKQILARMLQNLKLFYLRSRPPEFLKALAAVERILVVAPSIDQVRDRGLILRGLGLQALERAAALQRVDRDAAFYLLTRAHQFLGPAWFDLKLHARLAEGWPDVQEIGDAADQLWRLMGRHN